MVICIIPFNDLAAYRATIFVVSAEAFTDDSKTDFSVQLQKAKESGAELLFLPIYYTEAGLVAKAAVAKGCEAVLFGCDGLDGVEAEFGSMDEFMKVPQEVSFLSHFNTTATSGPAYDFVQKYNAKYDEDKEPGNQFGAAAYDCVYAIYAALKVAKANGVEFDANTSASDFCEILKEVFNSDSFTFRGITGKTEGNEKSTISWSADGTVQKEAIKYIVKEATN